MPKRNGRLRKDEFVETNIISGERTIKRAKPISIFGSRPKSKNMW